MTIGKRITSMTNGQIYTKLDWIKGDGNSYILTDILMDSVTWPVEIIEEVETYERNSDGRWPVIVGAGGQNDYTFQFGITNFSENGGKATFNCWYHDWIYATGMNHYPSGMFTVRFKKTTTTHGVQDVYETHNGKTTELNAQKWTTAHFVSPKKINIFCGVLSDGSISQQCKKVKVADIKFFENDSDTDPIIHFIPAMVGDVAGVYEEVNRKFYPESGTGKLVCCLDGVVLDR